MKYLFNDDDKSLKERICQINNVDISETDVSDFYVEYDNEYLNAFKTKIDEYRNLRFLIVGDYDCDGICATTIITRLLNDLKIENNYYIPSRSKEGYGLNSRIVQNAIDHKFDVIMCLDNGVNASEELKMAKDAGIKTLIIDHHEYTDVPVCDGFLHPDLFSNKYHDMCAAGLCTLLSDSYRLDDLSDVYGGLATLGDMVSVFGYNRYLIKRMMNILQNEIILPIRYLINDSNIDYHSLTYNVIPKINAVSRLEDMMNVNYVVRYLLNNDDSCLKYLSLINNINSTRKNLGNEMYALALRNANINDDFIVVKSNLFKEGLCGMIANRLMNEINKPVLILSDNGNELKGSGRSDKSFNLYEYLYQIKDIFSSFGGHAQAVGLSLDYDNYDKLIEYINNHEFVLDEQYKNVLLVSQDDIDTDMLKQIEELEPYGIDFLQPSIGVRDIKYQSRFLISNKYPKYKINNNFEAISFVSADYNKQFNTMIGKIKKDDYHNNGISMIIEDLIEF